MYGTSENYIGFPKAKACRVMSKEVKIGGADTTVPDGTLEETLESRYRSMLSVVLQREIISFPSHKHEWQ